MNRAPRALLVDMDGVLVDTESPALAALTQTFAAYGAMVDEAVVDRRFRGQNLDHCSDQLARIFADFARAMVGRRTPGRVFGCSADELARTYNVCRSALDEDQAPDAGVPAGFVAEARRRAHDGPAPQAEPGALQLLRVSVPRRIVTNSSAAAAARTLQGAGLDRAIAPHDVVTVDRVERGKPDPDLYLTAAAELGLAPSECLAVEDSLTGLRAARAAGVPAVGYAPDPYHRRTLEQAGYPTTSHLEAVTEVVA